MAVSMKHGRPRVVIIGGGFGGLAAARALKDAPVEVKELAGKPVEPFRYRNKGELATVGHSERRGRDAAHRVELS